MIQHRFAVTAILGATACMLTAACGGGGHDALRPDQPTAAGATGRTSIPAVEGPSSPLIVDWKAEQRADLEEIIHDGIAIVAWDKEGLRLLKRCRVTGNYGYLPVQVKKDVVRLETADDVQASLPLGGFGIAGKIGAGFSQGTTLDIAMAMVGKRRTTWNEVTRDDLDGKCEGATHYVRAILVGAFAMKTGSRAKAQAAVEIFGAGSSGESSSSKGVDTSDGKLSASLAFFVKGCDGGYYVACTNAGFLYAGGGGAAVPRDDQRALAYGRRACSGGEATACGNAGYKVELGQSVKADPKAALSLYARACRLDSSVCFRAGLLLMTGADGVSKDEDKAKGLLERSCASALGAATVACVVGEAVYGQSRKARPADLERTVKTMAPQCDQSEGRACSFLGIARYGQGDKAAATKALKLACSFKDPLGCELAKKLK